MARSRLHTGVWIARLLAGLYAIGAVLVLVLPGPIAPRWPSSVALGLGALGLVAAAAGLQRGSRVAAGILLALTLVGVVTGLRGGRVGLFGLLFSVAATAAFVNAFRGTLALNRIQSESRQLGESPGGGARRRAL